MVSIDIIGSPTWAFQWAHYWTPKIQDGRDLASGKSTCCHLSAVGSPLWMKFGRTGAEWHVDCGDMVEIKTGSIILTERTFFFKSEIVIHHL